MRSTLTTFLYALIKHDASSLPVAATVRVTEDGIEKPLANLGLVRTVTRLRGYRQDVLDERAGMAGTAVVVEEVGAPVLLVVRNARAGRLKFHIRSDRRNPYELSWLSYDVLETSASGHDMDSIHGPGGHGPLGEDELSLGPGDSVRVVGRLYGIGPSDHGKRFRIRIEDSLDRRFLTEPFAPCVGG